jgi:4-hydroxy-2-oxoheptanedioate aldolase
MNRSEMRLKAGETAIGILAKGGPHLAKQLGQAQLDFIMPDMMFAGMDWREAEFMIANAQVRGLAAYLRVQAYPWSAEHVDHRLAVDAARALSIGADGVVASVSSAAEVDEIVKVTGDWHRGVLVTSNEELQEHEQSSAESTRIFPLIETKSAVEQLDEILAVDGLTGVFIGVTDLSRELGHPFEYEHPDVWRVIDRTVELAAGRDIAVMVNTGYLFSDPQAIGDRVARLAAHGVQLVMLQTLEFLVYAMARSAVDAARASIARGVAAPA